MSIVRPGALCVALAAALPAVASAADSAADLKQLRDELRALRDTYQQRIDALEKRLADSEARATRAETTATAAARSAEQAEQKAAALPDVAIAPATPPTGEGAFNPAVSLILDSKFTRFQQDPAKYRLDGFIPSGGEVGPPRKGFSLGESELAVSANVDHLFRGSARFSLADENGQGTVGVVGIFERGTKLGHDGIANKFVDTAALFGQHRAGRRKIVVEHFYHFFGC